MEGHLKAVEALFGGEELMLDAVLILRSAKEHEVSDIKLSIAEYAAALQCCLDHLPGEKRRLGGRWSLKMS